VRPSEKTPNSARRAGPTATPIARATAAPRTCASAATTSWCSRTGWPAAPRAARWA